MTNYAFLVLFAVLIMVFFYTMRRSEWYHHESQYWHRIDLIVRLDPTQEDHYRSILDWAKSHRPGFVSCLKSWEDPERRMKNARNH